MNTSFSFNSQSLFSTPVFTPTITLALSNEIALQSLNFSRSFFTASKIPDTIDWLFHPFKKSEETLLHFPSCHVPGDESMLVAMWDIWGWVPHESKVLPFLNRSNEILTDFISKKCNEFVLGYVGKVCRTSFTTKLFQMDFKNWIELSDELDEAEEVTLGCIIIHSVTRSLKRQIPLCQKFDTSQ